MNRYSVPIVSSFLVCLVSWSSAFAYINGGCPYQRKGAGWRCGRCEDCRKENRSSGYYSPGPTAAEQEAARQAAKAREARRAALIRALQDADPKVRRRAACELAAVQPPVAEARPILVEALGDPDFRRQTAVALARTRAVPAEAVPAMVELLWEPQQSVRAEAVSALESSGSVSALVKALQHEEGEVRELAVRALGRLGPAAQDAVPALTRALKDSDSWVPAYPAATASSSQDDPHASTPGAWKAGRTGPRPSWLGLAPPRTAPRRA